MKKFDLIKHLPSNKILLLKRYNPNFPTGGTAVSHYFDSIGGCYADSFVKIYAKRFTGKWFIGVLRYLPRQITCFIAYKRRERAAMRL